MRRKKGNQGDQTVQVATLQAELKQARAENVTLRQRLSEALRPRGGGFGPGTARTAEKPQW